MLDKGEITLEPNHHHQAVGPMAGTISAIAWVYVVENKTFGNRAFCRQVEGNAAVWRLQRKSAGRAAHAGGMSLRPRCARLCAVKVSFRLKPIITQALQMGDELHNRHSASSSLVRQCAGGWAGESRYSRKDQIATLYLLKNHNLIFLGLAMAAGKAIADPARDIEYSSMVTAMCRNGVEFGIRVSGLGDEWFTAPAPVGGWACMCPATPMKTPGLDMGDSAITETVGWGGFVLGGATGILTLVGGTPEEALAYTREMRTITVGAHPTYKMPIFGFEGAPIGIDIRKVVQTNSTPIIDTAIAHKEPGYPEDRRRSGACAIRMLQEGAGRVQPEILPGKVGRPVKRGSWPGFVIRKNQYYDFGLPDAHRQGAQR